MLAGTPDRGTRTYLLIVSVLVLIYLVSAALLLAGKDFPDRGPLSPPGSIPRQDPALDQLLARCHSVDTYSEAFEQVVTAVVDGRRLHACYAARPTPGGRSDVVVIDESGSQVDDPAVLKRGGAWPWRGVVVNGEHLVYGVVGLVAVCLLGLLLYRAPLPGPALQSGSAGGTRRRRSWGRRARIAGRFTSIGFILVAGTMLFEAVRVRDGWGITMMSFLVAGFFLATVGAWFWFMHPDFDRPDEPNVVGPRHPNRASSRPMRAPAGRESEGASRPSRSRREVDAAALRVFRAEAKTRTAASKMLRSAVIFVTVTMGATMLWVSVSLGLLLDSVPLSAVLGVLATLVFWALIMQLVGFAAALLALPLILGWRAPARILLLRPFNRADHSRPLRSLARREAAGYGHVYSLADVAIKVRWYVAFPVLLGQLGLMSFRLARLRHVADVESLGRRVDEVRRRNLNWVVAYSKVFPVRCIDEVWQQSVMELLHHCDAVLMDVTDVTDNMRWEIEALVAGSRVEDCLFLALRGTEHEATATVSSLLCQPIEVFAFNDAGRLASPRAFRERLAAALFRSRRVQNVGP